MHVPKQILKSEFFSSFVATKEPTRFRGHIRTADSEYFERNYESKVRAVYQYFNFTGREIVITDRHGISITIPPSSMDDMSKDLVNSFTIRKTYQFNDPKYFTPMATFAFSGLGTKLQNAKTMAFSTPSYVKFDTYDLLDADTITSADPLKGAYKHSLSHSKIRPLNDIRCLDRAEQNVYMEALASDVGVDFIYSLDDIIRSKGRLYCPETDYVISFPFDVHNRPIHPCSVDKLTNKMDTAVINEDHESFFSSVEIIEDVLNPCGSLYLMFMNNCCVVKPKIDSSRKPGIYFATIDGHGAGIQMKRIPLDAKDEELVSRGLYRSREMCLTQGDSKAIAARAKLEADEETNRRAEEKEARALERERELFELKQKERIEKQEYEKEKLEAEKKERLEKLEDERRARNERLEYERRQHMREERLKTKEGVIETVKIVTAVITAIVGMAVTLIKILGKAK